MGTSAEAGKRRSSWHVPKIAGGYAIPQIPKGATARSKAPLRSFDSFSQLQTQRSWAQSGPRRSYGLDADKLTRPPSGPDDPVLKKFGLPYIPGVPTVVLLSPNPPADEFTDAFFPRR
jgi:hypothetical protein